MNLLRQLRQHARTRPDQPALIRPQGTEPPWIMTQAQLLHTTERLARLLEPRCRNQPLVPLCTGRTPLAVAMLLAIHLTGRGFACLNPRLKAPQLQPILSALAHPEFPALLVADALGRRTLAPLFTPAGELERFALFPLEDTPLELPGALPEHSSSEPAGCCLFTSGSTGEPKGVRVARQDMLARAEAETRWYDLTPDDRLLGLLPWSFDVGLNQLLSSLHTGSALVLMDSWMPGDLLKVVEEYRITGISAVPMVWRGFLAAGACFRTRDPHAALRYVTLSGGDLDPLRIGRLLEAAPGVGLFKTYGQTETFRSSSLRPEELPGREASVGRAFPGAQVAVVDPQGQPVPPGTPGEVVHGGLGVMLGYLGGAGEEEKRFHPTWPTDTDANGIWIRTGDQGVLDPEGYLYLHGRRDGMLKVAGHRHYPHEVTARVLELPGVRDAEVVGVPDRHGETKLVVFVILAPEAPSPSVLRRGLMDRLPTHLLPERIVPKTAFPLTANGKPDLPALTREAAGRVQ